MNRMPRAGLALADAFSRRRDVAPPPHRLDGPEGLRRTRQQELPSNEQGKVLLVNRLMTVPTALIEVFDRIDSPTMTGRLCGPFSTRRIVQWKSQRELYPQRPEPSRGDGTTRSPGERC